MAEYIVGSVAVSVVPSLDGFQKRLTAGLKKIDPSVGVDIIPNLDGFQRKLDTQLSAVRPTIDVGINVNAKGAQAKATATARSMSRSVPFNVDLDIGGAVAKMAALSAATTKLSAGAVGIGALTQSVLSLGHALTPAVGAVALLPAAGLAGGAAMGTLALGVKGFGEALKNMGDPEKFAEALANLAPAARASAIAIRDLAPAWTSMQQAVQQNLFAGMASEIQQLSTAYLPVLRNQLTGIAADMAAARSEFVGVLLSPQSIADTNTGLANTRGAFAQLLQAVAPLTAAFRDIAVVGSEFLPALGDAAGSAAVRFADFIARARASGDLYEFISQGLSVIGQIATVVINVLSSVWSIMSAAAASGANMLTVLEQGTGAIAAFLRSAQGAALLEQIFGGISAAMQAVGPLLTAVGQTLATTVLPAIAQLLPVLGQALGGLAPAIAPLGAALASLGPLIGAVAQTLSGVLSAAVQALAPVVMALAGPLTTVVAALAGPLVGAINAVAPLLAQVGQIVGQLLVTAFQALAPLLPVIVGVLGQLGAVFSQVFAAAAPILQLVVATIGTLITQLLSALLPILPVLAAAWQQIVMALLPLVPILLQIVMAVVQPLIGLIPVLVPLITAIANAFASVLAAVLPVVATILGALIPVINALMPVITTVMGVVVQIITWALNTIVVPLLTRVVVPAIQLLANVFSWLVTNIVVPLWNALGAAIMWVWNNIVKPAWDRMQERLNALGAFFQWVWNTVIKPAWDALGAGIRWVYDNVILPVWEFMQFQLQVLGDFFWWIWNTIISPAWNALAAGIRWVYDNIIVPCWNALRAALQAVGDFFWWIWNNVINPAWTAMANGIRWVWDNIIRPAFDLLNQGTDFVGRTFERVGNWIRDTWQRIQGFASKPIKWVIDLVYNNGIVAVWNGIAGMFGLDDKKLTPIDTGHLIGYAQGGIHGGRENHTAQIAPAGAWRVWAEPETGGEAYIPLASSKRARSTGVLGAVADEFGYTLAPKNVSFFADSGIWRGMWNIIQNQFPDISLTSWYRPGDPGHHGEGRAIDVAYSNWSRHAAVAMWIAQNYPNSLELISAQLPGGVGIDNGRPYHFGPATTAAHRNHVHWAHAGPGAPAGGGGLGGFLGGLFDIAGWLRGRFQAIVDTVVPGEGAFVDMLRAAPGKLVDLVIEGASNALQGMFSFGGPAAEGDMLGNARIIGQVARAMGFGRKGVIVALATALQESGLRNLNYGDRDSLGLFQQRPSQGWGTPAQILNPAYAASKFFEALRGVPGWQSMPVTVAAQRVQRSAFPNAYAKHVGRANTIADQIGFDQGGWMPPGTSLVHNGYSKPEAVLTPAESAALRQGLSGGAALIGEYHNHFHGDQDHVKALDHTMYRMRIAKLGGVHSAG